MSNIKINQGLTTVEIDNIEKDRILIWMVEEDNEDSEVVILKRENLQMFIDALNDCKNGPTD